MIDERLDNMRALIIGGAGFVGGHLIRHLHVLNWPVAITKLPHETASGCECDVYDLNILNIEAVRELLKSLRPDCVFHLAAQSSVELSWKKPGVTVDVNINGAVNVLEALRGLDKKTRTLLIGSGEEYGHIRQDELPLKEDNPLRPGNIYAATKACQGMLGRIYADAYGLDVINVRAFNHVGPGQSAQFVVSDFCKQVAEIEAGIKRPVISVGNLSSRRDFTDVRDVVRAYALIAQKGVAGQTYNVGRGSAILIQELLEHILALAAVKIEIAVDPGKIRPVDIPVIVPSIEALQSDTGWSAEIPLEHTLSETLNYWRKQVQG